MAAGTFPIGSIPCGHLLALRKIRLSFPHSVKISRQMCVMLTSSTQTHMDSCVVRSQGRYLFTQQVTPPLLIPPPFFYVCILLFLFFNTIQQIVGCDSIPCLCSGVLCLLGFFHAYLFLYCVREPFTSIHHVTVLGTVQPKPFSLHSVGEVLTTVRVSCIFLHFLFSLTPVTCTGNEGKSLH